MPRFPAGCFKGAFMIIIKGKKLDEKLVPADKQEFDLLKLEMEKNPALKKQLTTPMKDIPQYDHVHGGVPNAGYYSLFSVLEFLIIENKCKLLFSKAGNTFAGFVAYVEEGKNIIGLKIASFYDDKLKANGVMANDLKKFIAAEMPYRNKIEWEVEDANKQASVLYQKAIPKWFPQYEFIWNWDAKKHRWVYTISKRP